MQTSNNPEQKKTQTAVIIPAAGSGTRMGLKTPKQWVDIEGQPVLYYTAKQFYNHPEVDAIIIVGRLTDERAVETLFDALRTLNPIGPKLLFVEGGAERQDSVKCGFQRAKGFDTILVHDGARPFVSSRLITQMIQSCDTHHAAIPVIEVADTIKRVSETGSVLETLKRSELRAVQTPQAFKHSVLEAAFKAAEASGFLGTDDASLVEQLGIPVQCIPGEKGNFKLTTLEDLELAIRIIRRQEDYV